MKSKKRTKFDLNRVGLNRNRRGILFLLQLQLYEMRNLKNIASA